MTISLQEKLKNLDKLADGFNKQAGKTMMGRISKSEDIQKELIVDFISVKSLNVKNAMGGGIPKGKITIVSGNPDSGKVTYIFNCA